MLLTSQQDNEKSPNRTDNPPKIRPDFYTSCATFTWNTLGPRYLSLDLLPVSTFGAGECCSTINFTQNVYVCVLGEYKPAQIYEEEEKKKNPHTQTLTSSFMATP